MVLDQRVGARHLLRRRLTPHAFHLVDLGRQHVERHALHRDDVVHRADAVEEPPQLVRRRRREQHRAVEVVQQPQVLALVERVDVVDDEQIALVEDLPVAVDREHHRGADDHVDRAALDARFDGSAFARRRAAVDLPDADARAFEPFGKVRDVLANQVARRREDRDVAAGRKDRVDGDAQHHLGLAGAGRGLEQELELAVVEARSELLDRLFLTVGEGELLARLDQLVQQRDALAVLVDLRPDVVGRQVGWWARRWRAR